MKQILCDVRYLIICRPQVQVLLGPKRKLLAMQGVFVFCILHSKAGEIQKIPDVGGVQPGSD
jgi:uncharacterized membrane protein